MGVCKYVFADLNRHQPLRWCDPPLCCLGLSSRSSHTPQPKLGRFLTSTAFHARAGSAGSPMCVIRHNGFVTLKPALFPFLLSPPSPTVLGFACGTSGRMRFYFRDPRWELEPFDEMNYVPCMYRMSPSLWAGGASAAGKGGHRGSTTKANVLHAADGLASTGDVMDFRLACPCPYVVDPTRKIHNASRIREFQRSEVSSIFAVKLHGRGVQWTLACFFTDTHTHTRKVRFVCRSASLVHM